MLWSRPETKHLSGKLLIIGGNKHGFSDVVSAYNTADTNGAGIIRVVMPNALQKIAGPLIDFGDFTPSTPSGSFARESLATLIEQSLWADATLLAGDFGRNSETGILIESFIAKNSQPIVVTKDAADYYIGFAHNIKNKHQHTVVVSFAQLQKLATNLKWQTAFTFKKTFLQVTNNLEAFCAQHQLMVITKFHTQIIASNGKQTLIHSLKQDKESWRLHTAAKASVWLMQNPNKPIEAIACSLVDS